MATSLGMKKTNVYVDGFNLYYGCLKGSPYKWLDIQKLSELLVGSRHRVKRPRPDLNRRPSP
jgi:hypothetical protein